jgi:hypothetical protein
LVRHNMAERWQVSTGAARVVLVELNQPLGLYIPVVPGRFPPAKGGPGSLGGYRPALDDLSPERRPLPPHRRLTAAAASRFSAVS